MVFFNNLTPELKNIIDSMSYKDMVYLWRFKNAGCRVFLMFSESRAYFKKRMYSNEFSQTNKTI